MHYGRLPLSIRQNFRAARQDSNISHEELRRRFYIAVNSPEKMNVFIKNYRTICNPKKWGRLPCAPKKVKAKRVEAQKKEAVEGGKAEIFKK